MFNKNKLSAGSGSMSAVFVVLVLLVIIGCGIYYFQNKDKFVDQSDVVNKENINNQKNNINNANQENNENIATENENTNSENSNIDTNVEKESGEIAYYNDKYGFSLTFPSAWKGMTATYRELKWADYLSNDSIDFALPDQPAGIFNISVFTQEKWAEMEKAEGPNKPDYISENKVSVFAWSMSQSAANEEMQTRRTEVIDIIKSFRLDAKK